MDVATSGCVSSVTCSTTVPSRTGSAGVTTRPRRRVRFVDTPIPGAMEVELERHEDARGFFARVLDPR